MRPAGLSWNYEKYRSGSRQWDWTTEFSTNGGTSYTAVATGAQTYVADVNNTTVSNPPTQISKTVTLSSLSLSNGASLDFEWVLTGLSASTNGQGLGIDDFALSASFAAVPEPATIFGGALALGAIVFSQRRRFCKKLRKAKILRSWASYAPRALCLIRDTVSNRRFVSRRLGRRRSLKLLSLLTDN